MANDLTYAIGDIHGMDHMLQAALEEIAEDAAGWRRTVVLLGDYTDRGTQNRAVLRRLQPGPVDDREEWVLLKGNHEEMLVKAVKTGQGTDWAHSGGVTTLSKYLTDEIDPENGSRIYDMDALEQDATFLDALPYSHRDDLRMFVHAGVNPLRTIDDQRPHDLCSIRELFLFARNDWGVLIVRGHQTEDRIEIRPNRVNLDTGACYGHRLSVGVFDGPDAHPSRYFQVVHPGLGKEGDLRIERLDAALEPRSEGGVSPGAGAPRRDATARQWKP